MTPHSPKKRDTANKGKSIGTKIVLQRQRRVWSVGKNCIENKKCRGNEFLRLCYGKAIGYFRSYFKTFEINPLKGVYGWLRV